jgi:hypothetical protein
MSGAEETEAQWIGPESGTRRCPHEKFMSENIDLSAARRVAEGYFHDMLRWELRSAELGMSGAEETEAQRLARLVPIFEKYLTEKALRRGQSRYELLGYKGPPQYGRGITKVEPAGKGKVWVYTPTGPLGGNARYLLQNEKGEWRVDYLESDIANTGDWKKHLHL